MEFSTDTIAAIATPPGRGALAIVRVSGRSALTVCSEIWRGRELSSFGTHEQRFGRIINGGEIVDEVMIAVHRSPASFTGEDCVEITCHGGPIVTRRILDLLLAHGARTADPGEFTRRAFLNGRMDLSKAEAVFDMIHARTVLAQRAAAAQLDGALGRLVQELRNALVETLAHLEAWIDFPEEDIDPDTGEAFVRRVTSVFECIDRLLATENRGRILRDGLRVAIIGPPNAGKSSLLNALLGSERAIVSSTPGTTRDYIEESLSLRGMPVCLVDTAGIRDSQDAVEQAGIARSKDQASRADIVLRVFDGSIPCDASWNTPLPLDADVPTLTVLNKSDLPLHSSWTGDKSRSHPRISCTTGEGVEALAELLAANAMECGQASGDLIAIAARHAACFRNARRTVVAALEGLRSAAPPELVAADLRAALHAIGEVTGAVDVEEILDALFGRFCIGK